MQPTATDGEGAQAAKATNKIVIGIIPIGLRLIYRVIYTIDTLSDG